ncbi:MAG: MBL fold metallo-hydrolase [Thermodesulfobacteriota bacterium]|nr:MBL fold metallo-hydrolase [Thermodesulfobacteriota bacterium]
MTDKIYEPAEITPHFYQLGTPSFPTYLSMGEEGMIIEGGTGPTSNIIVNQIKTLGVDPRQIKYIALTHTHSDHIGAVPRLKMLWPHLKVLASPKAAQLLKNSKKLEEFLWVDRSIAEIMKAKKEIREIPPTLGHYDFEVDMAVEEGENIKLGSGILWGVYHTPGHSPCHIALYEEKEGTLIMGDTTGFYIPERDVFWPNYFDSLDSYCSSIRRLSTLPAKRGALSHNCVVEGEVGRHFEKALRATEIYHTELLERIGNGEDLGQIALDKARWVETLTDILPFSIMHDMCKLLIGRSRAAVRLDLSTDNG